MDRIEAINAKTRRAYNLVADRYHELFHDELAVKEYDRKFLDEFAGNFNSDSLICDAGCGPSAHIGHYLFDKGIPVIGVDISERCIELARRFHPDMRFEISDMGALPFDNDFLDGIIAYYSIIDTPKIYVDRIFQEFYRVLKPGGLLLVTVKVGSGEGYLTELLGYEVEIYFSCFSLDEIRSYYDENQFDVQLLEQRRPYDVEIPVDRIYAVGKKRPGP
ncbi:MAG TPA: class I SAM-dependent methyltransferase [Thermoanaerobaculia bacterium]|nr:class I SAM-dependent methyltransferase [Thermoanaerobaculia bacterium]HUM31193.1 class I SAM-dependent methyltransferase [Thermoanaerobaculia bacterium]HXK69571.1 class I SAM-dependent methyltransferase [Thermoanaerobaculia bacterium]